MTSYLLLIYFNVFLGDHCLESRCLIDRGRRLPSRKAPRIISKGPSNLHKLEGFDFLAVSSRFTSTFHWLLMPHVNLCVNSTVTSLQKVSGRVMTSLLIHHKTFPLLLYCMCLLRVSFPSHSFFWTYSWIKRGASHNKRVLTFAPLNMMTKMPLSILNAFIEALIKALESFAILHWWIDLPMAQTDFISGHVWEV